MRTSHVKIVRRSLVGLIALVLLLVGLNYTQVVRSRMHVIRKAAEVLSTEMMRSAESIEYSQHENGTVRFKVHAEKLLETRNGKSLLQGIEAFDFNPDGTVRNQIRSAKAEYDRENRLIDFLKDVRVDLGQGTQVLTDSFHYDLKTNVGTSPDRLEFVSHEAKGTARGIRYDQGHEILELDADVDFTLIRNVRAKDAGAARSENIRVVSQRGRYSKTDRLIQFLGHAQLASDSAGLSGDDIQLTISEDQRHITSLVSQGNALYESKASAEARKLSGDRMLFGIGAASGALENIDVYGHAVFASSTDTDGTQELRGSEIHLALDPALNLPRMVRSVSNVEFQLKKAGQESSLSGDSVEASFIRGTNLLEQMVVSGHSRMSSMGSGGRSREVLAADAIRVLFRQRRGSSSMSDLNAEGHTEWKSAVLDNTDGAGTTKLSASSLQLNYAAQDDFVESGSASGSVVLEGIPAAGARAAQVRRMTADRVLFGFYPGNNRLKELNGSGSVRVLYSSPADVSTDSPGRELRTASRYLKAMFDESDGRVATVSQWGEFESWDGLRTIRSGRSDYDAARATLVLKESPRILDTSGETTGDVVEYRENEKLLVVSGRVRSIIRNREGRQGSAFAAGPSYESPNVITAQKLEYWTEGARARYTGKVQMLSENGQLSCAELVTSGNGDLIQGRGNVQHLVQTRADQGPRGEDSRPSAVFIQSEALLYNKGKNAINYSGGVKLRSGDVQISSNSLDAILDKEGKRIDRGTATGKVRIVQPGRSAEGDSGEYYFSPGKFVVAGAPAVIQDLSRGKSTARQLTFFTTDDRILLENP